MTCKEAQSLLESKGWNCTNGGKHGIKMEKAGERPITLPTHNGKAYSVSLTQAILKQAKLK
jgi:predicted RNA binding protein YcfA (HicA-like mRNA interferase family)